MTLLQSGCWHLTGDLSEMQGMLGDFTVFCRSLLLITITMVECNWPVPQFQSSHPSAEDFRNWKMHAMKQKNLWRLPNRCCNLVQAFSAPTLCYAYAIMTNHLPIMATLTNPGTSSLYWLTIYPSWLHWLTTYKSSLYWLTIYPQWLYWLTPAHHLYIDQPSTHHGYID